MRRMGDPASTPKERFAYRQYRTWPDDTRSVATYVLLPQGDEEDDEVDTVVQRDIVVFCD
ncbi:MAG: hypothetical protein Q8M76_14670 [Spirochaetaceae bacterium]|nr:hypothetical protein [Spirochaetaceae bacterium]